MYKLSELFQTTLLLVIFITLSALLYRLTPYHQWFWFGAASLFGLSVWHKTTIGKYFSVGVTDTPSSTSVDPLTFNHTSKFNNSPTNRFPQGLALINSEWLIHAVDDGFMQLFSQSDQQAFVQQDIQCIFPPLTQVQFHKNIKPTLKQGLQWQGEVECGYEGSRHFIANLSISIIGQSYLCIIQNLTPQKEENETLQMFKAVVENTNDMVVITEPSELDAPNGPKIIYVNGAFEKTSGYKKEEVVGRTPRILQGPDTDKRQLEKLKRALKMGSGERIEVLNYGKNGYRYYNDIRIFPIRDEKRQLKYFAAVQRDTTNRKMMEEDLKAANKELETFTYITSHDMRAPLVNIKGFCGELEEALNLLAPAIESGIQQLPQDEQQQARKAQEKFIPSSIYYIKKGTERLDTMTSLLLALSRMGNQQLNFKMVDTTNVVNRCLDGLKHQIQSANISVSIGQLPNVLADEAAIDQIFRNILDNAVKYLDPSRTGKIEISGQGNKFDTIFSVTDNGRGIPEHQVHKIFEVFRRIGEVDHIPGEGMGMAFIKTLIQRHQGRVWCNSTENVGTTFYFSISSSLQQKAEEQSGEKK